MVLAFGETNDTDNFVLGGTINGKTIINGEVDNISEDSRYTVTLIDIPENMYVQNVSARAYVKKGEEVIYSKTIVTRCLAQGALNEFNKPEHNIIIDNILNYVKSNYLFKVKESTRKAKLKNDFFETNSNILEKDFINDWNKVFGTNFKSFTADGFYNEASSKNMTDISDSKIYKFFNDESVKDKWIWLIEYCRDNHLEIVHTVNQAKAILGDGTCEEKKLYYADHICYSIYNFFHHEHKVGGYTSVDFTVKADYNKAVSGCKILVNLNNYELIDVNKEYNINYNLNGKTWGVNSKDEYVKEFMKDFYEFSGRPGTLNEFMYGGNTPNNYQGTWQNHFTTDFVGNHLLYKNNLTEFNDEYFLNSSKYKTKWAGIASIIQRLNKSPRFGIDDTSFYGSAIDFKRYIQGEKNDYYNNEVLNEFDEHYNEPTQLTYKYSNESIQLHTPINPDFVGWYLNTDFSGPKITEIPANSIGDLEVYACYKSDIAYKNEDLIYDGTPVKNRSGEIVQIPNMYIQPDEQLRAVWVSSLTGDYTPSPNQETMKKNLLDVLDVLEYYNMNCIIFHIRIKNDALYKTDLAPIPSNFGTYESFEKWDYLTWFINECHSRGIEFHAWLNPYRIKAYGYSKTDTPEVVSQDYINYPKNPAHDPENILMTYRSDGTQGAILNPCKQAVQDYIVKVCLEVMQNYDVDAIHFDDYFYAQMSENITVLTEPDQQDYANYIKNNPGKYDVNSAYDKKQWIRDNIDNFIKKLSDSMRDFNKANHRGVQLGIAPTGIYRNGDGSVNSGSHTGGQEHYESYLFCDTKKWIDNEWIDYILPQSYWGFTHKTADYADVMDWWNKVVEGTRVNLYSGIGLYMYGEGVSESWGHEPYEISNQILYTTKLKNVKGVSIFCFKNLKNYSNNSGCTPYKGLQRIVNKYWNTKVKTPTTYASQFKK